MKKIFVMMLMALTTISALGQTRKVAILETVDREGRIPYGIKLIIRSSLAKGVADTKGYEAFERTEDLRKIFDEQNFQLTGNVSDEEIRKIGEMTGVQYVLVAEASQVDAKRIFITAKVLNVETARVEMTDGLMMKNNVKAVQKGAKKLGASLLKPYYQQDMKPKAHVQEQPVEQKSSEPKVEPEPVIDYLTIERISKEEYKYGDQWMTRMEYYEMINNRDLCIPAYQQFQKGLKLEKAGKWTLIGGAGSLFLGTMVIAIGIPVNDRISNNYYYSEDIRHAARDRRAGCEIAGSLFMSFGGAAMITGGTLWGVGVSKKDNAYKAYNDHCAEQISINLIYSGNGLGLALRF